MALTSDAVDAILRDSVFLDEEVVDGIPEDAIIVEGVLNSYAFHPERLETHRQELQEMIGDLDDSFLVKKGGGWTFLNLCMTKDDVQWTGLHLVQERFLVLCVGLKMARFILPKELWAHFPGGMPYVAFDPEGVEAT